MLFFIIEKMMSEICITKNIWGEYMDHQSGCCICGEDLIYKNENETLTCFYCAGEFTSSVTCENGHYVCDQCHSLSANNLIEQYCLNSKSENPISLALNVMNHPAIKMHGPEHHFLVPAVLLTAYYNQKGLTQEKNKKIVQAKNRAEKILGGFCGSHGNCGAAVGVGIFFSLIMNTTPLSGKEWQTANMMTSNALSSIAKHGGPRCCKRNSFLAIQEAMQFFDNRNINNTKICCTFSSLNKQCKQKQCPYYPSQ